MKMLGFASRSHLAGRCVASVLIALLAVSLSTASVFARDPKVPPGLDPGGPAIALIGEGVDYTDPELAKRLARDGEGDIVGWDFVDNDPYPYAAPPAADAVSPEARNSGTALAKLLLKTYRKARLIPVRTQPDDPASLARAAAFVARTPAAIAAVPLGSADPEQWQAFRQVLGQAPGVLFVVPAVGRDNSGAVSPEWWPAEFRLPNMVAVAPAALASPATPDAPALAAKVEAWMVARAASMLGGLATAAPAGTEPLTIAESVALGAAHAACAQHGKPAATAMDGRAAFLGLARASAEYPGIKIHDPMCWYGGFRF